MTYFSAKIGDDLYGQQRQILSPKERLANGILKVPIATGLNALKNGRFT